MTVIYHRVPSPRAAQCAVAAGPSNQPTAEFFLAQALAALRQAKTFVGHAERESPGIAAKARGLLGLTIVALERAAPVATDEEE